MKSPRRAFLLDSGLEETRYERSIFLFLFFFYFWLVGCYEKSKFRIWNFESWRWNGGNLMPGVKYSRVSLFRCVDGGVFLIVKVIWYILPGTNFCSIFFFRETVIILLLIFSLIRIKLNFCLTTKEMVGYGNV